MTARFIPERYAVVDEEEGWILEEGTTSRDNQTKMHLHHRSGISVRFLASPYNEVERNARHVDSGRVVTGIVYQGVGEVVDSLTMYKLPKDHDELPRIVNLIKHYLTELIRQKTGRLSAKIEVSVPAQAAD
jgi:hypothetical protein